MPFNWRGTPEMLAKIRRVVVSTPNQVEAGLFYVGQQEMTEAKRITPVWNPARPVPAGHTPGSLRASGQVQEPERHGRTITVTLSFGNELVDYAVFVHEDLEAHHATGQAKFLETTLHNSAPHIAQRVADRIDLRSML